MSLQSRWSSSLLLNLVFAACLPSMATAQDGASVSGNGSATVKRQPTTMRMSIVLMGKGKTLPEAIEKLKARRELAAAHLKKLQADTTTTKFGETALAAEGGQRAEMQRMMRMARGGRGVPKALDVPASVTVTCSLTADWPLKYQTSDELLVLSQQLQEKIKEADLCGIKEPKQLTPQEKELEEELAAAGGGDDFNQYGEPQARPGEPSFAFVATITQEERSAALAEAFGKAKQQAGQVAQAAGLKLGALIEVTGQSSADFPEGIDPFTAYQLRQRGQPGLEANHEEATSPIPGPVTAITNVQAKFRAN